MTFVQTRLASRCYFPATNPVEGFPRQWIERGANFVVAYAKLDVGESIAQDTQQESIIYVPNGSASIEASSERVDCGPASVTIAPPGRYSLTMFEAGEVLRVFSSIETIAEVAQNASVYADGAAEVAPSIPWPAPKAGFKLRHYRLADYRDMRMRMFRSSNLMINIFDIEGPRDPENLSPHSHDDFEQGSFAMTGEWVHSLRYPWSKRLSDWKDDEHVQIGSPSLMVIPATVIHTSRCIGPGLNQLVDIFCPPRRDFVDMGLVCNEDDYRSL